MRKIKIAQIGTSRNSHGNDIFRCLKDNSDVFEIIGFAFPENEREKFPERMAEFEGYTELTVDEILNNSEIEAVAIETEEIYLTKYAILAAEHGKHIHMEKPGGTNLADFEKLICIMKQTEKTFHTGYMYRYNPYIMELKEQIKNGEFGDIISVEAQMCCTVPNEFRDWLSTFPGGIMFFLGCHMIDLVFSIQGLPKKIITMNKCSGIDGINVTDFGMVCFEYENGVSVAKSSAVELGGFKRRHIVVSGTKKTVEIRPLEWGNYTAFTANRSTHDNKNYSFHSLDETSAPFNRYDAMMRSFAEMVCGERENEYSYDYELELYKLLLKTCEVNTD